MSRNLDHEYVVLHLGDASVLINVVELAATHSTTYKLKYIILHCAVVIVIVDVNVVDVVVGIVDINVVGVVSMVQVPAPRRFQKKI